MVELCPGARVCRQHSWPELLREVLAHVCQLLSASWHSSALLSSPGHLSWWLERALWWECAPCRVGAQEVAASPLFPVAGSVVSGALPAPRCPSGGPSGVPRAPVPLQIRAVIL